MPRHSPVVQIACGLHHTVVLNQDGECYTFGSNQYGQLGTGDLQPQWRTVKVRFAAAFGTVQQVAAGSNHTVLLTSKGAVLTFGNHVKGQLGRLQSDWVQQQQQTFVDGADTEDGAEDPMAASPVDVGDPLSEAAQNLQKFLWHCVPSVVNGIGPKYGKKIMWIGASGDQTFFKIDESLITASMLSKINVVADKQTIRKR